MFDHFERVLSLNLLSHGNIIIIQDDHNKALFSNCNYCTIGLGGSQKAMQYSVLSQWLCTGMGNWAIGHVITI